MAMPVGRIPCYGVVLKLIAGIDTTDTFGPCSHKACSTDNAALAAGARSPARSPHNESFTKFPGHESIALPWVLLFDNNRVTHTETDRTTGRKCIQPPQ
jgi:hypothetical protein